MECSPYVARVIDRPRPGYFRIRAVKGGPWVPARIRRLCHCTINGGADNASHDWTETCDRFPPLVADINGAEAGADRVWNYGHFLDGEDGLTPAQEYEFQRAKTAHNRTDAHAKVDLTKAPPVF